MFLCCRKVKWAVAKLWLMMGVSGVFRGLYDRLWDFLPTSDYEHCSKWLWKFLGFCHVFLSWCLFLFFLMVEGLCYWVRWRLEAWTREDEVWDPIVFFTRGPVMKMEICRKEPVMKMMVEHLFAGIPKGMFGIFFFCSTFLKFIWNYFKT